MDLEAQPGRETRRYVTFLGQPPLDARIAELASPQHAVIELSQLVALGLGASGVRKRVAAGGLHRTHQRVYSLVPRELLTREGRYMAAVLACGPGALLSHRSAAALHELRRDESTKIDVTVPSRSTRKHPGVRLHRSLTLAAEDSTTVNGIPCTNVSRTLLDIAEVLSRRALERALDQAEILECFDLWALQEQLQRNPTRRGARRLRATLDEHTPGTTPTWNEFEDRFLALVRAAGLPQPEVNAFIVLPDGEPAVRVDFVWREERLAVETDGHRTHRTRMAFEQDRRRDQRLTVGGWRPVRVTWRQLTGSPGQVKKTLGLLLER